MSLLEAVHKTVQEVHREVGDDHDEIERRVIERLRPSYGANPAVDLTECVRYIVAMEPWITPSAGGGKPQ